MIRSTFAVLVAACLLSLFTTTSDAAVRRRITIKTNPPGALVYIDDQEIGVTPVSTSFTYYGTRKIQIVKDGYETVTVLREIKPPWYQIPGIDFVTENLMRREFRDERLLEFQLVPLRIRTTNELIQRGLELKLRARQGVIAPLGNKPRSLRQSYPSVPVNPNGPQPTTQRRSIQSPQTPQRLPQR